MLLAPVEMPVSRGAYFCLITAAHATHTSADTITTGAPPSKNVSRLIPQISHAKKNMIAATPFGISLSFPVHDHRRYDRQ